MPKLDTEQSSGRDEPICHFRHNQCSHRSVASAELLQNQPEEHNSTQTLFNTLRENQKAHLQAFGTLNKHFFAQLSSCLPYCNL